MRPDLCALKISPFLPHFELSSKIAISKQMSVQLETNEIFIFEHENKLYFIELLATSY